VPYVLGEAFRREALRLQTRNHSAGVGANQNVPTFLLIDAAF